MIVISYIVSIVVQYIAIIIAGAITLPACGLTMKTLHGFKGAQGLHHARALVSTQFMSATLEMLISGYIALYSFSWFDVVPITYIALLIYAILWILLTYIDDSIYNFQPIARIEGIITGNIILYLVTM